MKTIVIAITRPTDGDLIIINAEAPGGGKTSVKHQVIGARQRPKLDDNGFATAIEDVPAETPLQVAAALAAEINRDWMAECVRAKVKEDTGALIINCTDLFSDVKFTTEVHGDGGTVLVPMEF